MWISQYETFCSIKNWTTLRCSSFGTTASVIAIIIFLINTIFNQLTQNFTFALGLPSGTCTCTCSFGATVLPHVENGWAMQNFWSTPCTLVVVNDEHCSRYNRKNLLLLLAPQEYYSKILLIMRPPTSLWSLSSVHLLNLNTSYISCWVCCLFSCCKSKGSPHSTLTLFGLWVTVQPVRGHLTPKMNILFFIAY